MPDTPKLFTPGPLNTTDAVKRSMLVDVGSRDSKMINVIQSVRCVYALYKKVEKPMHHREDLLKLAHVDGSTHAAVLLQGAGSYAVEAVFQNALSGDAHGKAVILVNGGYGERMALMCSQAGYRCDC